MTNINIKPDHRIPEDSQLLQSTRATILAYLAHIVYPETLSEDGGR